MKLLKYQIGLGLIAALAVGAAFYVLHLKATRVRVFTSSLVSENSPIAELATRKVVWRVFYAESTVGKDTVSDTVYTIKAGYDLSKIGKADVNVRSRTVTLALPAPKIISIDHFLQRNVHEKKTLVERVFGSNDSDGRIDRLGVVQLAKDCEKFGLLSARDLRESLVTTIGARIKALGGYDLIVEDGLDVPATALFNAYFEEKGVDFRL